MSTEEQYAKDMELYKQVLKAFNIDEDKCETTESEKHPIHPHLFWTLSSVSGFASLNGRTYHDYLEKYKTRYNKFSNST